MIPLTETQTKKFNAGKCIHPFCRKARAQKGRMCHMHYKRAYKENNPLRYLFNNWKGNCRRRGKKNTVTFEEFKDFCAKTGYVENRGRTITGLQIDRKKETDHYHAGNIQAITCRENRYKYSKFAGHNVPDEEVPF